MLLNNFYFDIFFPGELAAAVRSKTDIKFGLYYSLFEWFHPLYLKDAANNFSTQDYMKVRKSTLGGTTELKLVEVVPHR